MPDYSFFKKIDRLSLRRVVDIAGDCEVVGTKDLEAAFSDVATLKNATSSDVSFMHNRKYMGDFLESKAGLCLVTPEIAAKAPEGKILVVCKEPYRIYGLVASAFYPKARVEKTIVHEKAVVAKTAKIGEGSVIQAGAVIGENAVLGKNCEVHPNAVIGDSVVFGDDCIIGANASVYYTKAGNQVYVYAGARIGQDGFGFFMSAKGHTKIPQLGRVIIGNDVEIGANTCVDRGALEDTVIGDGSRLDNLIQVAHNLRIGKCCVFAAQVGSAGSTEFGDFVAIGGQAGFAGHLKIGSGAQIGGQAGVISDVEPMAELIGMPAQPMKDFFREVAVLKKMIKKGKEEK